MHYNRRFTGRVTAPIQKNQVFVFNSYSNGINKAGTAKAALTYFGAKPGIGEGPTGQSYAIPSEVPLKQMREAVKRFIDYARIHPELEFLVTPIGVGGVFKRDVVEMANLFSEATPLENVILPEEFVCVLNGSASQENHYSIGPKDPVNYKLIDHDDCEFNESAVIKQDNGHYTLAGLDNMVMGGAWRGFWYSESMKDFDKVLLSVIPKNYKVYSRQSEFVQSCVIANRNGLWGCVSTRCEDYSRVLVPFKYMSADEVKEELKAISGLDVDFVWKPYEEYIRADELNPYYLPKEDDKRVDVFVGDITKLKVDAIVNAANTSLLGGGGIDGAIHQAAGPQLLEECKKLGGCKVGESKMTDAYNLPCKKIIHTVGPDMRKMTDVDEAGRLLENCYKSVLDIAVENHLKSVVFCCISTGIFRFPKPWAARRALSAIYNHPYDGLVKICCYTNEDKSYYDIEQRV